MRNHYILFFILLLSSVSVIGQTSVEELDKLVSKTNVKKLDYDPERIIVRGFDAHNPPPRLEEPERPLFYGYGMTAYFMTHDHLQFFKIDRCEAVHRTKDGEEVKRFELHGNRYTDEFKTYFTKEIDSHQKKYIFFENIYIHDKQGNYFKITSKQKFCTHCAW